MRYPLLGYILIFFLGGLISCKPSGEKRERLPLKTAFERIEQRFQVSITVSDSLVSDLYGSWPKRASAEENLLSLLQPHHLMFRKTGPGAYHITPFETGRRPVEEGRAQLQYLGQLYNDRESWENRKEVLRECMLKALKLSPLPSKPVSDPIFKNKRRMDGYTIENVAIETIPGYFVTGSLYRPSNIKGEVPVILNPNGHFANGRYRPDQQYRMGTLARMGAITFSYDLFGWGESQLQVGRKAHRTPLAMTVQVLNGMRILDFLTGLEHVDKDKVAITGGSGGGSQTMLLTALDRRIDASVPVVMLSSYFNGGCSCESGRPVHLCGGGTNNVEIAAMAAPRPQLVISDGGDWTADVPKVALPWLREVYGYYGKKLMIENKHFPTGGHDYGRSKRTVMYHFLARHLGLDLEKVTGAGGDIDESDVVIEQKSALYVFGREGKQLPVRAVRSVASLRKKINIFR